MTLLTLIKPVHWPTIVSLLLVVSVLLWPDLANAQADAGPIKSLLYFIIMSLTGWMLWMGGILLDYGVNTFVINFGINFNSNGVGVAVNQLWVIVRDLFNILFIFGLVYIGFKMILNSDDSRTKQTLVYLILAALLINFSLFITKFVVDFTNILASEVAVAGFQLVDDAGDPILGETNAGDRRNVAIGDTFFNLMRITPTILNPSTNVAEGSEAPWSYIFGIGIINIIGAFAFGVGGIMLIIRFVALSVYMVLSPFMFLGWVFPGFQSMSSKYWSGFFKQAFYAPVYIVMIFFAATILNNFFAVGAGAMQRGGIGDLVGGNGFVSSAANTVGGASGEFGGGLAPFILSAAFLIAAVQVAGKLASDGSGVMNKISTGVNARVRGAVRGGGRFAARNTFGYANSYIAQPRAEAARRGLNRRTANWAQGNAVQRWAARTADTTAGAGLDRVASSRVAGSETAAERRTRINSAQANFNNQAQANDRQDAVKAYKDNASDENKAKAAGAIAKMSDTEILSLSAKDLEDSAILANLSEAQIKTLTASGKFNNEDLKTIKKKREDAIFGEFEKTLEDTEASAEALEKAMEGLAKTVKNLSSEQLAGISADRLATEGVASQLSDKQLDSLRDSGKLTSDQFSAVKKARDEGIARIATTGGVKAGDRIAVPVTGDNNSIKDTTDFITKQRKKIFNRSAQDVGKLPDAAFTDFNVVELLTPQALQQKMRNGGFANEADRQKVENNIRDLIKSAGPGSRAEKMWKDWPNKSVEGAEFNFE